MRPKIEIAKLNAGKKKTMTQVEKIYTEECKNSEVMILRSALSGDRIQVYRESYALLIQVFELTVNIQKDYKSIPGEDIKHDCLKLVRSVLHASDAEDDSLRLMYAGRRHILRIPRCPSA